MAEKNIDPEISDSATMRGSDLEAPIGEQNSSQEVNIEKANDIKAKRKQIRARITRTINRLKESAKNKSLSKRRIDNELKEMRKDFQTALQLHGELYDYVAISEHPKLDAWENELSNDIFTIEENMDDFVQALTEPIQEAQPTFSYVGPSRITTRSVSSKINVHGLPPPESEGIEIANPEMTPNQDVFNTDTLPPSSDHEQAPETPPPRRTMTEPFDSWIDRLVEFSETRHPDSLQGMSVADALYRLEASKDIPAVHLNSFDGNPLAYCEFIDTFKIHVHDKRHLNDNFRMIQLKMHLVGDAERAITGLGSDGIMYATALKLLKDQFGQQSVIARALVKKLTSGPKISQNDRYGLRSLMLDVVNCLATLQRLNYFSDANSLDCLRQIVARFPNHLISKWKNTVSDIRERGEIPTLGHISMYLRKQVKSAFDPDFGDIETSRAQDRSYNNFKPQPKGFKGVHSAQPYSPEKRFLKCNICEESHTVSDCAKFLEAKPTERLQLARDNRLCFGCLNRNHMSKDCRSKKTCNVKQCIKKHHYLLHTDPPSTSIASLPGDRDGILPVIRARFRASNGQVKEGNILVDSGAGATLVRKEFSKSLGLQGRREGLEVAVVGGDTLSQKDSRRVRFWVSSMSGGQEFEIEAHELDRTVASVPPLDRKWLSTFPHLNGIDFSHKSGPIDLILGVQYSHLHAEDEVRQGLPFEPIGKHTKLGWHVIGAGNTSSPVCSVSFVDKTDMAKFYDFETLGIRAPNCDCPPNPISPNDKAALDMFESSCRKEGQRYVIGLPWRKDPSFLPDNYCLAEKRLLSLERSLLRNPEKAELYKAAAQEFENNGWSVPMSKGELDVERKPVYYLPHHGVYRPDKPSTPLRIVFDPACSFKGVSLNSFLLKGPNLIGDLFGVLLRFREQPFAFVGDISKMFLQILLEEKDTHVHRYLWRALDLSKNPTVYRLTRVTFGDKPSPDMASFVLLKLAKEHNVSHPEAAEIIDHDRYMDDLIHSCMTQEEATKKMSDLDVVLSRGSFKIKKWHSSFSQSLEREDLSNQHVDLDVSLDKQEVKTLGVSWSEKSDVIYFRFKEVEAEALTKRLVLSRLSMLFDPLGLASVITIKARVAMQAIWKLKLDWDEPLPQDLTKSWKVLFQEMKDLETVCFPRSVQPKNSLGQPELHVFSDASATAYGAVAYIVWNTTDGRTAQLLCAKARVAPLHQTTVPRLELMAALIASRLAKTVYSDLRQKPSVTLWSDSQIVLHWAKSDSITLKAFVGVRIAEIQSTWESHIWKFVPSALNPADDLSRGLKVKDIDGRWMKGPDFLLKSKDQWPEQPSSEYSDTDLERKTVKPVCAFVQSTAIFDCTRFSDWRKLLRVTSYCHRFIHNLKKRIQSSPDTLSGALQPNEIDGAEVYWIKWVQANFNWKERCKDLSPIVQNGIVRVGGRLRKSDLPYDEIHQIVLPSSSHVTKLILQDIHERANHPGSERTLSESRRKYWILRGRNLSRSMTRNCTICRRLRQPLQSTLMGDLPAERLKTFSPPFTTTGIDLFGPFNLKYGRNKTIKAWGAIFTCATIRAIHLEIVDSLSTQSFLHALRRFAAHHGWPTTIISDNGTSFVGAQKELRKLVQEGRAQLQEFALLHRVKWIFITPLSPHQGGFYESIIKQVKRNLQVVVGKQTLTWNEMATVFAEVKCLINSRPLSYSSSDPNDPQPLTPNHLLLGRASSEIPQGPFEETRNLRRRFEFVQALTNQFWKRFLKEYLPTLMSRQKWQLKGRQLVVGDVVLLADANTSRGNWQLGKITDVFPGDDGIVRNVEVKTRSGTYRRSIQRLCLILGAVDDQFPSFGVGRNGS